MQKKIVFRAYVRPNWIDLRHTETKVINGSIITSTPLAAGRLSCAVQTLHSDALDRQRYGTAPVYLREHVQPGSQVDSRPNMRSSDNCTFFKLRTWTKFAERRPFFISSPASWNALQTELRLVQCKDTFKRRLKTFYRTMLRRARYCYGKLSVCPSVRNVEVL